jgi:PTH1 family peptidyl-tRNA hydrolase
MEQLGKGDFIRLRIGIGKPVHGDTINYVLGHVPPEQMETLPQVLDGGLDMLEMMLDEGLPKAMSMFNNRNFLDK